MTTVAQKHRKTMNFGQFLDWLEEKQGIAHRIDAEDNYPNEKRSRVAPLLTWTVGIMSVAQTVMLNDM